MESIKATQSSYKVDHSLHDRYHRSAASTPYNLALSVMYLAKSAFFSAKAHLTRSPEIDAQSRAYKMYAKAECTGAVAKVAKTMHMTKSYQTLQKSTKHSLDVAYDIKQIYLTKK